MTKRKSQGAKRSRKQKKRKGPPMAETADRHALYQDSVQCVESEIDFVDETYERLRGRKAALLREDFCGTGNTSCEWVRRRETNRAVGVDNDPEVLAWGREHNVATLEGDAKNRVGLIEGDVRTLRTEPVDILLAMNFSYWLFDERRTLLEYFRAAREHLADDGVFFLDAYGGYDAPRELEEERECEGFTYIWDQAAFNPIDNRMKCKIHFHFPDGSKMKNAFEYQWRLWSIPEIRELLGEAGFGKTTVYWEGTDEETEEGDGVFEPTEQGDADAGWIAYISAEK